MQTSSLFGFLAGAGELGSDGPLPQPGCWYPSLPPVLDGCPGLQLPSLTQHWLSGQVLLSFRLRTVSRSHPCGRPLGPALAGPRWPSPAGAW